MEQVLKSKPRSSRAPLPPPPPPPPPHSSIVSDDESSSHSSDVSRRKRKRRSEEGENSDAIVEETSSGRRIKPPVDRVYTCKICGREYQSHQALGGHQNVHKVEKALEMRHRELFGPVMDPIRTGYGPVHSNPPLGLYNPFRERLYGVAQPLVPTRGPHGYTGEWLSGWGDNIFYPNNVYGFYGGESSNNGVDPTRDLTIGFRSSGSGEGGDGAARDDDDNEDGVGQAIDLTLKI